MNVKARDKPWKGKKKFLSILDRLKHVATLSITKEKEKCPICKKKIAFRSYSLFGFNWCELLVHCVKVHNHKPDKHMVETLFEKGIDR